MTSTIRSYPFRSYSIFSSCNYLHKWNQIECHRLEKCLLNVICSLWMWSMRCDIESDENRPFHLKLSRKKKLFPKKRKKKIYIFFQIFKIIYPKFFWIVQKKLFWTFFCLCLNEILFLSLVKFNLFWERTCIGSYTSTRH